MTAVNLIACASSKAVVEDSGRFCVLEEHNGGSRYVDQRAEIDERFKERHHQEKGFVEAIVARWKSLPGYRRVEIERILQTVVTVNETQIA